jgi:hypothetical protein
LLEPVKADMACISCGRGLVYIRQTGGSIGNKVKEHHHLDIPAVAVMTSNSRKPVFSTEIQIHH